MVARRDRHLAHMPSERRPLPSLVHRLRDPTFLPPILATRYLPVHLLDLVLLPPCFSHYPIPASIPTTSGRDTWVCESALGDSPKQDSEPHGLCTFGYGERARRSISHDCGRPTRADSSHPGLSLLLGHTAASAQLRFHLAGRLSFVAAPHRTRHR